jgi:hypothetical protein
MGESETVHENTLAKHGDALLAGLIRCWRSGQAHDSLPRCTASASSRVFGSRDILSLMAI